MSKLTPAHLPALVKAWQSSITDGTIPARDADAFVDAIHDALLHHQVQTNPNLKRLLPTTPPALKDHPHGQV